MYWDYYRYVDDQTVPGLLHATVKEQGSIAQTKALSNVICVSLELT